MQRQATFGQRQLREKSVNDIIALNIHIKGQRGQGLVLCWPNGTQRERACMLQLCLSLCDLMDCSPPGFSVHGILQARILEWVAMTSSRGSSQPGTDPGSLPSSALAGGFFTTSITWEAQKRAAWEKCKIWEFLSFYQAQFTAVNLGSLSQNCLSAAHETHKHPRTLSTCPFLNMKQC